MHSLLVGHVHHVECNNQGDAGVEQLGGQVEAALQAGGIDDIDQEVDGL